MRRHDLVLVGMPAVVEDHVHVTDTGEEPAPEARVALIADVNLEAGALPAPREWIDVYPDDPGSGPEVVPPHEERAAVQDAHLDEGDLAIPEPGEQFLVDLEIRTALRR